MSNQLIKETNVTYVPGSPGVDGDPGQPYIPAYTSYESAEVCDFEVTGGHYEYIFLWEGYVRVLVPDDPDVMPVIGPWTCQTISVPVYHPEQPFIAPTPGTPPTPEQFISDFNLGWNSGARSIKSVVGDAYAQFKVPSSLTGGVLGFNASDIDATYGNIEHAFYFSGRTARVYESGVEAAYIGAYADGDLFRLERISGTVMYYQNGTLKYTSATPSVDQVFLDSSLYAGGDYVYDPAIGGITSANGAMLALVGLGGDVTFAQSEGELMPVEGAGGVFSGGDTAMLPLIGIASNQAYADSQGQLLALTGSGGLSPGVPYYALGAGAFSQLLGAGLSSTSESGQSAGSLQALVGLASNMTYGDSQGVLAALTGSGSAPEGNLNASMGALVLAEASYAAQPIIVVVMNSAGAITGTFALNLRVEADAFSDATSTPSMSFVSILTATLQAMARVGAVVPPFEQDSKVYVVNLDTDATSTYEDFPFNSYMRFGDSYFGVKGDGVFLLEGDTDNGAPIRAALNFGKQNFGSPEIKRMTAAYLGLSSTGTMYLKVTAGNGATYTYAARRSDDYLRQQRVDVGRGLEASYFTFELLNNDGADFELATTEFQAAQMTRRI